MNIREPSEGEAAQIEKFSTTMAELETLSQEMREVNQFNNQLDQYKKAAARLSRHILAEGVEPVYETIEAFDPRFDVSLFGSPLPSPIPETQEILIDAGIDPLPATIEVQDPDASPLYTIEYGEGSPPEETIVYAMKAIPNPEIEKDNEERAAAQAIVDSTPQEVIDFVTTE